MRTRVKICGITDSGDLRQAVDCGADAVGFNLFEGSPRYVTAESAARLVREAAPFVTTVCLFVNHDEQTVRDVISEVRPGLLQFHGDEAEEFCRSFGHPFIKVLRVSPETDIAAAAAGYPSAAGIMLDAHVAGAWGGTGQTFDWNVVPALDLPVILAGGLTPDNVTEAIRRVRPFAVDVSSGVEAVKGRKDPGKVAAFTNAVRKADEEQNG